MSALPNAHTNFCFPPQPIPIPSLGIQNITEEKVDVRNVSSYLTRVLRDLLKLIGSRKFLVLSRQSQDALNLLEAKFKTPASTTPDTNPVKILDQDMSVILAPLLSAFETKTTKIVLMSLEAVQKLIHLGCVRPDVLYSSDSKETAVDVTVRGLSSCVDMNEENIHVQLLKVLHSVFACAYTDLHGENIVTVLEACNAVFMTSKSSIIQKQARSVIVQVVREIFSRWEQLVLSRPRSSVSASDVAELFEASGLSDLPTAGENASNQTNTIHQTPSVSDAYSSTKESSTQMEKAPDSAPISVIPDIKAPLKEGFGSAQIDDAFLAFRWLCLHSLQSGKEGNQQDGNEIRQKCLALELIQMTLANTGTTLRRSSIMISSIRQYLCVSLLKNGVSNNPTILGASLGIFLSIIANFKEHLKVEIGVFFTHVFLSILESHNSTLAQKMMIVAAFLKLTQEPQIMVDIFLNYDCNPSGTEIFARMMNDLSKIAREGASGSLALGERDIRISALSCLVSTTRSLVRWCEDNEKQVAPSNHASPEYADRVNPSPDSALVSEEEIGGDQPSTDFFEKKMHNRKALESGIQLFNTKPNKAVSGLIDSGVLLKTPESVASFLHLTEGLSKSKIGEYLGEGDAFNISVMYAYVDQIDFKGLAFDEAIRHFLRGFRLPGEAQKIDRLMEKFAEKYCRDCPGSFKHADTAYVLAYSIIMLNTDAHNPMVKHKMTKAEFVRNSSHLHEDEVLPQPFLEEIYDRIVSNEIRMKGENRAAVDQTAFLTQKQRAALFSAESEDIVTKSQQLFKQNAAATSKYHHARGKTYVRPMFGLAWALLLPVFNGYLDSEEDPEVVSICLDGFWNAIRIASLFYMEKERNALISGLSKFASLLSVPEIRLKNVESMKTMLSIASVCGNDLESSWEEILVCISELEELRLGARSRIDPASRGDSSVKTDPKKRTPVTKSEPMGLLRKRSSFATSSPSAEESYHMNVVEKIAGLESDVDLIFTRSHVLTNEAIVSFVRKLCLVSLKNIEAPTPRTFCLQKIVEIASFNMGRIRYVWSTIWSDMAKHLSQVGCHHNKHIAMYAIDSLRQLAMKFLEKEELVNYHFQKEFLKPFEYVMTYNQSLEIRELVINCLQQMVAGRAKNIKSGWKSIFLVYGIAAGDTSDVLSRLSFQAVEGIIQQKFVHIAESLDTFVDCVNCLVSFGCNTLFPARSVKALEMLRSSARSYLQGTVIQVEQESTASGFVFTDAEQHLQVWFPILTGLSRMVIQHDAHVRSQALILLVDLLLSYGALFSPKLWELIFRGVMFPIFDDIRHMGRRDDMDWVETTCVDALIGLTDLFSVHFPCLNFLLKDVLDLYRACIIQVESENLSKMATTCLHKLILTSMQHFDHSLWDVVIQGISELFRETTPIEILSFSEKTERRLSERGAQAPGSGDSHAAGTGALIGNHTRSHSSSSSSQDSMQGQRKNSGRSTHRRSTTSDRLSFTFDDPSIQGGISFQNVRTKCVTQLSLIQMTSEVVINLYPDLGTREITQLAEILYESYKFAAAFNKNHTLRVALWRAKFMSHLPNLSKQEISGITSWLKVYFKMYKEKESVDKERVTQSEDVLLRNCLRIIQEFVVLEAHPSTGGRDDQDELSVWIPVIQLILDEILGFSQEDFTKHLPTFFSAFVELTLSNSRDVRQSVKRVLMRIGTMHSYIESHCGEEKSQDSRQNPQEVSNHEKQEDLNKAESS